MSRQATPGARTRVFTGTAGESAQVAGWLVAAVRAALDPSTGPPLAPPPPGLAQAAARHGVEGQVLRYAEWHGVEVPGLRARVHSALARHQRVLVELQEAQRALAQEGVEALVVKGPALACGAYRSPELRSYVDLDLLVAPMELGTSVRALESRGFRLLDANWPLIRRRGLRELRLSGPLGGAVDLHWSLSSPTGASAPPVRQLLASARVLTADGVPLQTLSWADTVVHVATHAADSGGHRLVWLTDLRGLLEQVDEDRAGHLVRTAQSWGAVPALHLMLARAERVLGMQLPGGLGDAVRPRGWWGPVVALTDSLAPFERAGGEGSLGRLVARASRDTSARSCATVVAKAFQWLGHAGAPPPTAASMNDPGNPQSALHPAGGAQARESFFAMVEGIDERPPTTGPRFSR